MDFAPPIPGLIHESGHFSMRLWGNDYNKMEFAGAFGDLGTLIPFVVGYITLNKMDPSRDSRRLRHLQDFCGPLFQDTGPDTAHEGDRGHGHLPRRDDHSGNDLGIGHFHGTLLAFNGSDRSDHLDREGNDQTRRPGNHAGIGSEFHRRRIGDDEESASLCHRRGRFNLSSSR